MKEIKLRNFSISNNKPLTLMGGVNVLESEEMVMRVAEKFKNTCDKLNINWIFKGSYDKANRSSINSFRGPGMEEGLKILEKVSANFDCPVITDFHEPNQAKPVSEVCEIIQVPAFLARQTDLVAAAKQSEIFDNYYDKYKKDFVTMQQSEGRVSPKLWGNPPPKERKKKS